MWSILRPDGFVVATIRMPEGFVPMDVTGDQVVGLTRDELGVERILVFQVSREGN